MGMPLDYETSSFADGEELRGTKLPPGMLEPTIDVVKDIYGRIYADPK